MIDFSLWDERNEFTLIEAARLWEKLDPKDPTCEDMTNEKARRAHTKFVNLGEAVLKKKLPSPITIIDENDLMVVLQYTLFDRNALKDYASSIGQKPEFLFPEERTKSRCDKGDWGIKDFTPYLIRKEHFLDHAAYLYHEVNPAFDRMENPAYPYHSYLAEAIGNTESAGAIIYGSNPSYKYRGPLPEKIWGEIKETYKILRTAAKEGTLPTRADSDSASADDMRKFFTEILDKRPRFLFPEESGATNRKDFVPGPDFRSATWKGKKYSFTARQAQIIEMLHNAFLAGAPDVGQDCILEKLGSPSSRLRDAFQENPAWGCLIVGGSTKGAYRLNL